MIIVDVTDQKSDSDCTKKENRIMTGRTRNNDKALAAFIARKAEIDNMLARLQTLSEEHFNADPEEIHWGHVGDLADMATKLREITDRAFGEGEYAE
jgi:hypothetical protein